jgi:hypothetical protein
MCIDEKCSIVICLAVPSPQNVEIHPHPPLITYSVEMYILSRVSPGVGIRFENFCPVTGVLDRKWGQKHCPCRTGQVLPTPRCHRPVLERDKVEIQALLVLLSCFLVNLEYKICLWHFDILSPWCPNGKNRYRSTNNRL